MKESIEKRIALIKEAEDSEALKKCVCPFYEKGGHPDCMLCRKTDADLEECRDYYLERIALAPMDIWDSSFDTFVVMTRDKVKLDEVAGIGINCDNCYMSDKCPLYKRGYICGIDWGDKKPQNAMEFMDFLIDMQYERVKRAQVYEKVDGGVPDANLSGEMDRLSGLLADKANMGRDRLSISVEASSPAAASGGGILSKIFGGGGATSLPASEPKAIEDKKPDAFDITELTEFEEVKEPVKRKRKNG